MSRRQKSILDKLGGMFTRKAAKSDTSKSFAEEREEAADAAKDAYAQDREGNRRAAYTAITKDTPHEYVPEADNRDELIAKASPLIHKKLEAVLGKGGSRIEFDDIHIKASHEDMSQPNQSVIDKALLSFEAQVQDASEESQSLGFVVIYDADEDPEFALDEEFLLVDSDTWSKASASNIREAVLESKGGKDVNKDRQDLVYFDGDSAVMGYRVAEGVVDLPKTLRALQAAGFEVTCRYFGPEQGLYEKGRNAYEFGAYSEDRIKEALGVIKKVNATMENEGTDWDTRADDKKPNEFKAPDFEDRAEEKSSFSTKELSFEDRTLEKSKESADGMKLADKKETAAERLERSKRAAKQKAIHAKLRAVRAKRKAREAKTSTKAKVEEKKEPSLEELATQIRSIADGLEATGS